MGVTRLPSSRSRPAALLLLAALLPAGLWPAATGQAQTSDDRAATLRALADGVAAALETPGAARPDDLPPPVVTLLHRLAPPEPIDYYGRRTDAVVEEALLAHRPDVVGPWRDRVRTRRLAATRALMAAFREALEGYALDHGAYPPEAAGLPALTQASGQGGPYLGTGFPVEDGWGRPLVYRWRGGPGAYDLFSVGPDGVEGTPDDFR